MAQSAEPIRIRITERQLNANFPNPRDSFWAAVREKQDEGIAALEGKLCREFGLSLRDALIRHLSKPLQTLDSELFPGSLRDLDRFFMHFGPPEKEWYRYQAGDVVSKFLQYRQDLLQGSPTLREVQERIAAASSIVFSTRIVGYGSLSLDLSTGSFEHLAKVFDGHFDTFRVFLDAFIPVAFADVFDQDSADRLAFDTTVPQSVQESFNYAAQHPDSPRATPVTGPGAASGGTPAQSSAREKAEWIWRLANGSLIIPVLLTILIAVYGLRLLSDIRQSQYQALQPILQHQLELLREDRSRFSTPCGQGSDGTNAAAPKAPSTDDAKKQKKQP